MQKNMLSFIKPKLKTLAAIYFYLLVVAVFLVTLLPYWPFSDSLVIAKYALLFGPRWWLLIAVVGILFFWRHLSTRQLLLSPILILLSLNFLDFQLPSMTSYLSSSSKNEISVLTANIGSGGSVDDVDFIGARRDLDIILLQEARRIALTELFTDYKFKECVAGLCILSKHPFERIKVLNRKLFQGWGVFAIFYQINTPFGEVSLANIHFETPRSVLMGLMYRVFDVGLAKTIESNRQFQADLVGLWSKNKPQTLVVGDFNMPEDENIYQRNFSHLHNALGTKGFGFNATKKTAWHSVRIDHVLYSDDFKLKSVGVIEAINGDHQPVVATFSVGN